MLPISLVEKAGFIDYVEYLNPSFSMPTRNRIRDTGLPGFKTAVELRIMTELLALQSINISLDGWTDGVFRCFNGYHAQGFFIIFILL